MRGVDPLQCALCISAKITMGVHSYDLVLKFFVYQGGVELVVQ